MIFQLKFVSNPVKLQRRAFSAKNLIDFLPGTVIFSKSRDIFRNLAFEDWIYNNIHFKNKYPGILLMWWNNPAVVIGRHQNPWVECNLKVLRDNNIQLARRNSGGGTVYHDLGNLNCSFLTSRSKYRRKINLQIICKALQKWNIDASISKREDIILGEYKISGTASKLGRENAYHHCTVLISVKSQILKQVLNKNREGIINKATESVKSEVINLNQLYSNLTVEDVANEIAQCYHNFHGIKGTTDVVVYPNEDIFFGIEDSKRNLESWEWIYGRTPRFTVYREFIIKNNINLSSHHSYISENMKLNVEVVIYYGKIENIYLKLLDMEICPSLKHYFCGVCMKPNNVMSAIDIWINENKQCKIFEKYIVAWHGTCW